MSIRNLHILILVSVAYVAAQMVADISNLRNLTLFGFAVSGFSIAYPLTFTLRDMAHKLAGPHVARTLIIAAAVIYLVVQAFFTIISGLPPQMSEAERISLGELLTPEWRFLLAAVLASVISQLVDTEVYTRWVQRFGQEKQWGRVLASNIISIPLDRVLFLVLALAGTVSTDGLLELFIGTTIVRLIFGIITIPGIYLVEEHSEDWVKLAQIK
ncbi:MAG: queuosine precursor transporter [Chloroflexi bacterium]|nr:queuosine precursor transporter [Chloroflexota bacterium]